MNLVAFKPEHLDGLVLQPAQASLSAVLMQPGYGEQLARCGPAFTAMADGQVIGCGGAVEMWENRALVWALVTEAAGPHMLGCHRAVEGFLKQAKWRRIEAYVDVKFAAGKRWAKLLGFEHEGTMKAYSPEGDDHELFARVR